jgi:methylase of polypeptide subunit release factors
MSYPRHPTLDPYLAKVRRHREPYAAQIRGLDITIFPNVMSPLYDRSAQMFMDMMPALRNNRFLEIGSGSGIISIFAAKHGALEIVAVDINASAIENTKVNLTKHGLHDATVMYSDLFERVDGRFDTIFFNAPFHGSQAMDELELGACDEDYKTLKRFFNDAKDHLAPRGRILLGFADSGDNGLVHDLIEANQYVLRDFQSQANGDWSAYLYTISL